MVLYGLLFCAMTSRAGWVARLCCYLPYCIRRFDVFSHGALLGCVAAHQNTRGNTCLHYCYAYKFPDLAEYLLSKGADDSIVNLDGMTCYEAEVSGGLALSEVDAL